MINVYLGNIVGAGVLERRIREGKIVKMMTTRKKNNEISIWMTLPNSNFKSKGLSVNMSK